MEKRLIVFIAIVTLTIPTIGLATPPRPGTYISGFVGAAFPVSMDVTATEYDHGARTYNDKVEFDPNLNIGGSSGFDFGFVRIEGELAYKHGEMSSIINQTSQVKYANVDGRVGVFSMMVNTFFDLRNPSPVTPYIGGGIGLATLSLGDTYATNPSTGYRVWLYESGSNTVFAYQAGAGLEIALNNRLSLDLGYRYFGTAKTNFNKSSYVTTEMEFRSHNASVGLRWKW
jgi:opacity protein-like surface antigen